MCRVTAEAALGLLGEDDVPLVIDYQILAGRANVGAQRVAEMVELAAESVEPGPIVGRVVVHDAIDFSSEVLSHEYLVEGLLEAFGPDRRIQGDDCTQ